MEDIIVRYLHFVGIISLAGMLMGQNILIAKQMSEEQLMKLTIIDALYGMSALIVLASGLLLWFWVGKPSEFYTASIVFHIKFGLFLVVALLSIASTIFFVKNRTPHAGLVNIPAILITLKRLELLLVFLIPLLAVLMAGGIGSK
jgi:putative membrane protein